VDVFVVLDEDNLRLIESKTDFPVEPLFAGERPLQGRLCDDPLVSFLSSWSLLSLLQVSAYPDDRRVRFSLIHSFKQLSRALKDPSPWGYGDCSAS